VSRVPPLIAKFCAPLPSSAFREVFCSGIVCLMVALVFVRFCGGAAAWCQWQEVRQEGVSREGADEEDVSDYLFFSPFVIASEFDGINCSDGALNLRATNV
jgi:hypothetical protein